MTISSRSSLLRAEWRRLFARRVTRVMMLLVLVVLATAAAAVGSRSHPHTATTLAQARSFVAEQRSQNLAQCLVEAAAGTNVPGQNRPLTPVVCRQMAARFHPSLSQFQGYQFTFHTETPTFLFLFGGLLALFGFIVGSSFVGAEWSSGGIATLLVWRPRRIRLLAGKLLALLLGVLTFAAAASIIWIATLWSVARWRGDASHVTAGLLTSLALSDLRALALALACTAAGFAIASYGRHTSAALGAAVGYTVVIEVVLRIVLTASGVARPQRFYLTSYVFAWLNKTMSYAAAGDCRIVPFGGCPASSWSIGMGQSAALIGSIVVVALAGAAYTLHRRDVT